MSSTSTITRQREADALSEARESAFSPDVIRPRRSGSIHFVTEPNAQSNRRAALRPGESDACLTLVVGHTFLSAANEWQTRMSAPLHYTRSTIIATALPPPRQRA